jgi:protoheme IX farnesyltransferase
MIKDYYTLTKPGIIYGNAITVIAGFFLASHAGIDWKLLVLVLIGLSLIIASGCVFNNYIDRDIDALMERTKKRALVRRTIPLNNALIFGVVLGALGIWILAAYTNKVTLIVSLIGLFVYVVIYSMWLKRSSIHSALIGGISGAVPPVVGYVAVSGTIDVGAIILFSILVLWQMPHSFAIAIYRLGDYSSAHIPVLPVVRGIRATKIQIAVYTVLFVIATLMLFVFGYSGKLYVILMSIVGVVWIWIAGKGLTTRSTDDRTWAKKLFMFSIITLLVWCLVIMVEHYIA